jgi:ketosteroid isomerase-like protein
MKIGLLLALAGLAISFAESALAQEKATTGPQTVQQRDLIGIPDTVAKFDELHHKLEEAYNKNDAAAVVALFTEDAVLVAADGIFGDRQHIAERYADAFQRSPITDFVCSHERYYLNAIDGAAWSAGEWSSTFQSQTGPAFARGYWSAIYVPDGDAWKIRLFTITEYKPLPQKANPPNK